MMELDTDPDPVPLLDFRSIALLMIAIAARLAVGISGIPTEQDYSIWVVVEGIVTIIAITLLLSINRHQLGLFNWDKTSGFFLIFALLTRFGTTLEPVWISWIISALGLWYIYFFVKMGKLEHKRSTVLWLFAGLGVSFLGIIIRILLPDQLVFRPENIGAPLILSLFAQLSHNAIPEEVIFRGFLWGYLKTIGFSDWAVLLLQTFLFWIAHVNYYNHPYSFWLWAPWSGVVFGLLVMKSKSLAPAIIAHTISNAFITTIF